MERWNRFWHQPTIAHRNAQLFFASFTVIFAGAALAYAFVPDHLTNAFAHLDGRIGGRPPNFQEQCRIWEALAAANVATLSVMCSLLTRDIHRNAAVHFPLLFMKSLSAVLFTMWWVDNPRAISLCLAALGDGATGYAIWYFARAAWAERRQHGEVGAVSLLT